MKLTQILRLLNAGWQIEGKYGDYKMVLKDEVQPVDSYLILKLSDLHLIKMSGPDSLDLSREGIAVLLEADVD